MHKAERTCTSVYAAQRVAMKLRPSCLHELAASQAAAGSIRSKGFQDCKASGGSCDGFGIWDPPGSIDDALNGYDPRHISDGELGKP